ncbi:MAG: radical SAM protein [Candidatus Binatia bacterium]|nr:radical SAM protein [Candidatus Binatia bacterium]
MIAWQPDTVWIERGLETSHIAGNVHKFYPDVPQYTFDPPPPLPASDFATGKRQLVIQRHRGSFLHHCPAGTPGLVCCNYLVVNLGANCPFDCSYCFLQEYLAHTPGLRLFANVADALAEIDDVLRRHPQRRFRIGTGELIDSLALDHLTGHSQLLIPFFAERPNAVLELKTKSVAIDGLLQQSATQNVVVAWSLNAASIIDEEEPGTASLSERLAAAQALQQAGYRVAFHFDPLVAIENWEESYRDVVRALEATLDPHRVAWISLGHLRLSPGLKRAMKERQRGAQLLAGELVPGADGKQRAWRGIRLQMYRALLRWLAEWNEGIPRYICMEPAGVWEKTFGEAPTDQEVAARLVGPTL